MAGIESLKRRIIQEDEERARAIEIEAENKADKIINDTKIKIKSIMEESETRAHKEGQSRKERIIARAQLDGRNAVLAAKQEAIDRVLSMTEEKIMSMDNKDYILFLENLILNNVETGDEEIIFSQSDRLKLDDTLVQRINQKLNSMGRKGMLKVSESTANIMSGFVLKRGGIEINCSIQSQLRLLRDELEGDIASILFEKTKE